MARWDYKGDCGHIVERDFREVNFVARCDECAGEVRLFTRIYSTFASPRPMQEHFNSSVGQVISSDRQFDEALKRQGERVSNYTGLDSRWERVDPTDTKTLKVDGAGLDSTNRERHAKGLPEIKP